MGCRKCLWGMWGGGLRENNRYLKGMYCGIFGEEYFHKKVEDGCAANYNKIYLIRGDEDESGNTGIL